MVETLIISCFAVLLAFFAKFKDFKYGLELAFFVLAIFISIRYNWGNDYMPYLNGYEKINRYTNPDLIEDFRTEVGWNYLNYYTANIGFFGLQILLTFFEFFIIYRYIKKFVPNNYYWLSVLIFTINTAYMLVTSSMMRQFLAMTIVLIAIEQILKKRIFAAVLLIFISSLFHKSALILIPFCLIKYINIKMNIRWVMFLFILYILLYFNASDLFGKYIFFILENDEFDGYTHYLGDKKSSIGSGFGVFFNFLMVFLCLFYTKIQTENVKILFILFICSSLFTFFGDIAPLIGRLSYYFSILIIIVYPLVFKSIQNIILKNIIISFYVLLLFYSFFSFFEPTTVWYEHFYEYKTIFSSNYWR